jgi:N-acetylglucosamine-6-phosphate deacetylase
MEAAWVTNARVVTGEGIIPSGAVRVEDGRVTAVQSEPVQRGPEKIIDGGGRTLIPGMIDVHIHGAGGHDMMDGTTESIEAVSRLCAQTGCTAFLATSVTSSLEDLLAMIDGVARVVGREPGARIVGIHSEGPYLNVRRKGMQNEAHLRNPDLGEMERIVRHARGLLKMVTVAPELSGGLELVDFLRERGIIASVGHSDATYETACEAFERGASHVTHCFNQLRPIHHRDPGPVVAAFERSGVSLEAIVDGVHLHPAIVRLMHRVKGPERVVLITDAMQAMLLGDGTYRFGGHEVTVQAGRATLADGTLASSTVTMNQALRRAVEAGIPLQDAVRMASATPAELLGLRGKGRIAAGADADLVLLEEDFGVAWTMVGGRIVSQA